MRYWAYPRWNVMDGVDDGIDGKLKTIKRRSD